MRAVGGRIEGRTEVEAMRLSERGAVVRDRRTILAIL